MSEEPIKKLTKNQLRKMIGLNEDARQYFYSQADERWLEWLWSNGFLDVVRRKKEDADGFVGAAPELGFLHRMAKKVPSKVVDILIQIPIDAESHRPEGVHAFLDICSGLPADQLARVVGKIQSERWVPLMQGFDRWGFSYSKMLETLLGAGDFDSLLVLAKAILEVRPREEEAGQQQRRQLARTPFFLEDVSYTKVFESVLQVDEGHAEAAFALLLEVMGRVVDSGEDSREGSAFQSRDSFHLLEADFFSLKPGERSDPADRDDVLELAAVVAAFARRLIEERCGEKERVREIHRKHIEGLPQSRSMWRLRLFALGLCPEAMMGELQAALFRLFGAESYYEILAGAEYMKALRAAFPAMSEDGRREFVRRAIERFSPQGTEDDEYLRIYGSQVLSVIEERLTPEERNRAEEAGFKLDPAFEPEPSVGQAKGGFVKPKGPVTEEQFGKMSVLDIALKLRDEWAPARLAEQDARGDFLNPLNAEGVGDLLKVDIPKRLQAYVDEACAFFERGRLDEHYTYSFLSGIEQALKEHPEVAREVAWEGVLALAEAIMKSGDEAFDRSKRGRESFASWLAGWDAVHSALTNVIRGLLTEKDGRLPIGFPDFRERILGLLRYLLSHPDPAPADEELETAKQKTRSPGDEDFEVSDPFSIAINSVRGRSFEVFTMFVNQDGKRFGKEEGIRISADLKELYEGLLRRENTRALMFMFGHYLPNFYFRDKDWVRGLLPEVFPSDHESKPLYTAAWEGYLVNNLFEDLFFDPAIQALYERGLGLKESDYPRQKHFRNPGKAAAIHLALAFIHYRDFGFEHPLFRVFWDKATPDLHGEFVDLIGRSFVSGSNARSSLLLEKNPESRARVSELWDWLLKGYHDPRLFKEFGFWISLEKGLFEPVWLAKRVKETLAKTRGALDWPGGLTESIIQLAKSAPGDSLAIVRSFLLDGAVRGDAQERPFYLDAEWAKALEILYREPETQAGTAALIKELVRDGGSTFWSFKKILGGES